MHQMMRQAPNRDLAPFVAPAKSQRPGARRGRARYGRRRRAECRECGAMSGGASSSGAHVSTSGQQEYPGRASCGLLHTAVRKDQHPGGHILRGGDESGEGDAGGDAASALALQASLRDASAGNMLQRPRVHQRLLLVAMAMLAKVAMRAGRKLRSLAVFVTRDVAVVPRPPYTGCAEAAAEAHGRHASQNSTCHARSCRSALRPPALGCAVAFE